MTLLASNDSRTICQIQLSKEGRWVSLALSLGERGSSNRFLVSSAPFLYEMTGVDDAARNFGLSNWQGGIISGVRYAFRALKAPVQQVCIHELRGQLASGDIIAVSSAAAVALARLLGRPADFPLELAGWDMKEEVLQPQSKESPAHSADFPPTSQQPAVNGGLQDHPAKAGAVGGSP
jgi:hypothetical protein